MHERMLTPTSWTQEVLSGLLREEEDWCVSMSSPLSRKMRWGFGDSRPILGTTEVICAFNRITEPLSLFILEQREYAIILSTAVVTEIKGELIRTYYSKNIWDRVAAETPCYFKTAFIYSIFSTPLIDPVSTGCESSLPPRSV